MCHWSRRNYHRRLADTLCHGWWTGFLYAGLAFALLALGADVYADKDSHSVDELLKRLGLTHLRTVHLEQVVTDGGAAEPDTIKLAKQLADLYASEMMTAAEDADKYEQLLGRVRTLIERIPQAKTDSLEAMMLQADYRRAEALSGEWLAHRDNAETRQQALSLLVDLATNLGNQYDRLAANIDRLNEKLDKTDDESEFANIEAELANIGPIAAQTGFFAGWANYYHGVVSANKPSLAKARRIFHQLLSLDDEPYDEIEADWLALESPWRARTWIGLSLVEAAMGQERMASICFRLLRESTAPTAIREQADYWHVQALMNASSWDAAEAVARRAMPRFSDGASQGKVSLCTALLRGAYCGPGPAHRESLAEIGMTGLIAMRQWSVLQEVMSEYDVEIDSDRPGFAWKWICGHRLRVRADANRAAATYRAARDSLEAALSEKQARSDLGAASQCRAELAWCQFQLGQFDKAAGNYGLASSGLERNSPRASEQAAWMEFVCFDKLARTQSRFVSAMGKAADSLRDRFPDSEYADKAAFAVRRMSSNRDPESAIVELEKVARGDNEYLTARRDICQLRYTLWRSAASGTKKTLLARSLKADWEKYRTVAKSESAASRLRVGLWGLEAAISVPLEAAFTGKLVAELEIWAASTPELAADFHYMAQKEAAVRGELDERRRHLRWLLGNAAGTRFELSALIVSAKQIEADVKAAGDDQTVLTRAYDTYRRLSDRLGNDLETLKSQTNARVAMSRLAYFSARLGKNNEAAELSTRLVEAQPRSREVLTRACQIYMDAARYKEALQMTRTLLRGANAGSDPWYEAKLNQLRCLRRVDRQTGVKVWQQFQLLDPKMGGAKWRERFEEVGRGFTAQ
jgi:tetratricopeptide (TPR) repeat protein